jgi:hypothetical protein
MRLNTGSPRKIAGYILHLSHSLATTFTVFDKVFNNPLYFFHEVVHAVHQQVHYTDMGKKDFHSIYSEACRELGSRPTIKVSHFSDRYDHNKNFAGVIVYHNRGSFTWYNERGVAKGYKGRAIYLCHLALHRQLVRTSPTKNINHYVLINNSRFVARLFTVMRRGSKHKQIACAKAIKP